MTEIATERDAWEDYCAAEKAMFEAGAIVLRARANDSGNAEEHLREIIEHADEANSDTAEVARMILGEKDVPEGWRV